MKKGIVIWGIFFLSVIILTSFVLAFGQERVILDCSKNCSITKDNQVNLCDQDYKQCRNGCNSEKKACIENAKDLNEECRNSCSLHNGTAKRMCIMNCSLENILKKEKCSKTGCVQDCVDGRKDCKEKVMVRSMNCKKDCDGLTVLNKEQCDSAGGLFYLICKGLYFDIICSKQKFCICDGDENYSCPSNYTCNHNLDNILPRNIHALKGYKDLLGNPLGDIGICMKESSA
jgi:hypothetical protein